jgi:adenylate cyclase, class 2
LLLRWQTFLLCSMSHLNIEIKARCSDPDSIREYLRSHEAIFMGLDKQTDTYFKAVTGRLKLREGNIENNLIYYKRENTAGPKSSHFQLIKIADAAALREVLTQSMGVLVQVIKNREIYYIDNVKFHIDEVPGLGNFVEIEAGNILADLSEEKLQEQCDHYCAALGIRKQDMIAVSYSDMLLARLSE